MKSLIDQFKTQLDYLAATLDAKTLSTLVLFMATLIGFMLLGKLAASLVKKSLKKMNEGKTPYLKTALEATSKSMGFLFFYLGLSIGLTFFDLGNWVEGISTTALDILLSTIIWFTIYNLIDVVNVWLNRHSGEGNMMDNMLAPLVLKTLKVTVVVLFLLQFAQVLSDKPVTSVIAGLGVGGLAVALAAQETIRNFFGSLIIFSDKPFEVGERILVDSFDGVIEEVGFRSTRLRTLTGHLVTIPNGELANKSIENVGKRPHIRRLMNIGITYDTPADKISEAVQIVKNLLENHEGMHPDFPPRAFFNDYGNFNLNILVLYWYHPGDYWKYMEFSEKFNLELFKKYEEAGIDFAFPTQTLHLAADKSRPMVVYNDKFPE